MLRNFKLYDSPLERGDFVVMVRQAHHARHYILSLSKGQSNDKGVCKFAATHPRPLFLEGSLKVAAECRIWLLQSSFVKILFVLHVFLQYMIRPP